MWEKTPPAIKEGILIGCDANQEWMLKWWHLHYSKHNKYPLGIVDFGMSAGAKSWCRQKGLLIPLQTSLALQDDSLEKWSGIYQGNLRSVRNCWFKKPLALLQTPFQKTLWLDIDCEVRGSLDLLLNQKAQISLVEEPERCQKLAREKGFLEEGETLYNSGVIAFKWGSPIISAWADKVFKSHSDFMGDQDALSRVIFENAYRVKPIPPKYNWRMADGHNPKAVIVHWVGEIGKQKILKDLQF